MSPIKNATPAQCQEELDAQLTILFELSNDLSKGLEEAMDQIETFQDDPESYDQRNLLELSQAFASLSDPRNKAQNLAHAAAQVARQRDTLTNG